MSIKTSLVMNRAGKVGRPPKVLQEQRILEIVEMLLQAKPRRAIYEYVYDTYGVGQKTTDNLITEAYKIIREKYAPDRDAIINQHIQKYYQIVENCEGIDNKNQIAALQAIEKLLRLHQADTLVQHNTLQLDLKDYSVDDLKKLLGNND